LLAEELIDGVIFAPHFFPFLGFLSFVLYGSEMLLSGLALDGIEVLSLLSLLQLLPLLLLGIKEVSLDAHDSMPLIDLSVRKCRVVPHASGAQL
jgi:hypothetical protein